MNICNSHVKVLFSYEQFFIHTWIKLKKKICENIQLTCDIILFWHKKKLKFCENSHDLFPDVKRQISRVTFS